MDFPSTPSTSSSYQDRSTAPPIDPVEWSAFLSDSERTDLVRRGPVPISDTFTFPKISDGRSLLPVSWNVEIIVTFQQSKNKSCRSWCMYSICFLWTVTNKDHISPGERGGYEDRSRGCVTKTGCSAEETDKNRSASSESVSSTEGFLFHSSWQPGCHTSLWIKDSMTEYILPDFQKVEKLGIKARVIVKLS